MKSPVTVEPARHTPGAEDGEELGRRSRRAVRRSRTARERRAARKSVTDWRLEMSCALITRMVRWWWSVEGRGGGGEERGEGRVEIASINELAMNLCSNRAYRSCDRPSS